MNASQSSRTSCPLIPAATWWHPTWNLVTSCYMEIQWDNMRYMEHKKWIERPYVVTHAPNISNYTSSEVARVWQKKGHIFMYFQWQPVKVWRLCPVAIASYERLGVRPAFATVSLTSVLLIQPNNIELSGTKNVCWIQGSKRLTFPLISSRNIPEWFTSVLHCHVNHTLSRGLGTSWRVGIRAGRYRCLHQFHSRSRPWRGLWSEWTYGRKHEAGRKGRELFGWVGTTDGWVPDCVCCWKSCVTETYLWGTLGSLRNGLLATPISSGTVACTTHGGIDIGDSTPEGSLQQSCHWALQVKVYKGDRGNYMSKGFGIWVLRSWHICEKTRPSIFWDRSKGSTSPRQAFWDEAWNANPTLEASYLKHFEFSALLRFPKKSHEIAFVQGPATLESTSTCRKKTAFAAFANVSL